MSSDLSMCTRCGQMTCEDKASLCDECSEQSAPTNPERLWWFSYVRKDERSEMVGAPDRGMVERFHAATPAGCDPSPVAEYVRADVSARETRAAVLEAIESACAERDHEKETAVWLANKNDDLEGKLAEMEMAANPAVYDSLNIQRLRMEETRRQLGEIESLKQKLAASARETAEAVAKLDARLRDVRDALAGAMLILERVRNLTPDAERLRSLSMASLLKEDAARAAAKEAPRG